MKEVPRFKAIATRAMWSLCGAGRGGGGRLPAYPLTKQDFQLKNDKIAFKMGNQVDCYLLLPCLLGYGKHLPAYQLVFLLPTEVRL